MLQLNAARVAFETVDIPDYTTPLLLLLNTIQNSYSVSITNHNKNKTGQSVETHKNQTTRT